jgi:hypothetical protein
MLFSRKKVPVEEQGTMSAIPVESLCAYLPVPAPVYLLLSGNSKFVAVKAPLDFFTPDELQRFKPLGSVFFPSFYEKVRPFSREAAQLKQTLVGLSAASESGSAGVAPFELSDQFLKSAGRLWSDGGVIEPFFVAVFCHELCGPIPAVMMEELYSRNVLDYEQAVLRSGWLIWQALHLGYFNLRWLTKIRDHGFRVAGRLILDQAAIARLLPEPWMVQTATQDIPLNAIGLDRTAPVSEQLKLWSRGERLRSELIQEKDSFRSIFGPGGFRDG